MANHLKNEHSPYLQQHADNPVDWYPWGEKAFKKAQKENKPIFLSIGYSSCHWCHVMEHESFEDEKTAKILNEKFISIKVDREERPDIDKHFQDVYRLMNGRPGGWPTSIFLTEDLKPFYSATYIPDEPKYGMMSFKALLDVITDKYKNEKETLVDEADKILRHLNPKEDKIQATKLDESIIARVLDQANQLFDSKEGGFNKAPKFPQASTLDLLLDLYRLTGEKEALNMSILSLSSMARGGLYDRIEGGFCRYSTDNEWLVPHFEKMTYDNALLSEVYLKAYHVTNNNFYKDIAFETIDFMLEKMSQDRLFYSASDADTEGEEGKYFVYSYDKALKSFEKAGIPSKEHEKLAEALHITKEGNFEGKNIIRVDDPSSLDIPYYKEAVEALKKRREKRVYPFIDTKVLVSWNAMMIKSLFKAARTDSKYLKPAIKSLDKLLETMYINSQLFHSTLIGKEPKIQAFLEDYAFLGETLIEAYESTLDEKYLITATKLANSAIEKYYVNGKWKFSRGEFETDADIHDSSYPSSVSTMISLLYSLSSLVDIVYKKFVFKTLEIYSYDVMRQPISTPKMSRMIIRYLKDDIIIKATEEKLALHITELDAITYPFTLIKNDTNDGFMLCNSNSCFGHEKDFKEILKVLEKR
ncbi:thioredoxin domain-containing protein [Sulfurovum sp. CS9]|uniref:thioredoxin domain-containing protein n=1 Tax=Sulfurovum sp. CS9 TaxID=3391146 RepID=UPI0039ECE5F1